jgi:hypothetical protein
MDVRLHAGAEGIRGRQVAEEVRRNIRLFVLRIAEEYPILFTDQVVYAPLPDGKIVGLGALAMKLLACVNCVPGRFGFG